MKGDLSENMPLPGLKKQEPYVNHQENTAGSTKTQRSNRDHREGQMPARQKRFKAYNVENTRDVKTENRLEYRSGEAIRGTIQPKTRT